MRKRAAALFILFLIAALGASGQTNTYQLGTKLNLKEIPAPRTNFDIARHAQGSGLTNESVGTLSCPVARLGKANSVSVLLVIDRAVIQKVTIKTTEIKQTEKLRKQLVKQFGDPYSLVVYPDREILTWNLPLAQRFTLQSETTPDDKISTTVLDLR